MAGCSSGDATSQPNTTANPAGSSGNPKDGEVGSEAVPHVAKPLNETPFLKQPCALVNKATTAKLGHFKQKQDTDSKLSKVNGPSCEWVDYGSGGGFSVALSPSHQGLSAVYAGYKEGRVDSYKIGNIDGYPQYPAALTTRDNDKSGCGISLGISDDRTIELTGGDMGSQDKTCDALQTVAKDVLQHLTAGK